MSYIDFFAQLFVLTFAIFAGLLLAFRLIWPKVEVFALKTNLLQANRAFAKDKQQLQFAAYERLILLTQRIQPVEVMLRQKDQAQTIPQFRQMLLTDIEHEFQHNFTQQLYVADSSWVAVVELKDNTLRLFRNVANELPDTATVQVYFTTVLQHIESLEKNPYHEVQQLLKRDLSSL